jgi:hypothetical protein
VYGSIRANTIPQLHSRARGARCPWGALLGTRPSGAVAPSLADRELQLRLTCRLQ